MRSRGFGGFAAGALVAGAILWSFATTDVELSRLQSAGPRIADFLGRMVPPDPTVMNEILKGSAETLRIAILGSLGAVLLSVPSGYLRPRRWRRRRSTDPSGRSSLSSVPSR